jgi:hypothetical protein
MPPQFFLRPFFLDPDASGHLQEEDWLDVCIRFKNNLLNLRNNKPITSAGIIAIIIIYFAHIFKRQAVI